MTTRRCLPWPNSCPKTPAADVAAITDDVRAIWDDMIDTMDATCPAMVWPLSRSACRCGWRLWIARTRADRRSGWRTRKSCMPAFNCASMRKPRQPAGRVGSHCPTKGGYSAFPECGWRAGIPRFRRSLGGDVGAASDRPSGRKDVFRPPLAVETKDMLIAKAEKQRRAK